MKAWFARKREAAKNWWHTLRFHRFDLLRWYSIDVWPRIAVWLLLISGLAFWLYCGVAAIRTPGDLAHPGLLATRELPVNSRLSPGDLKIDSQATVRVRAALPSLDELTGRYAKQRVADNGILSTENVSAPEALARMSPVLLVKRSPASQAGVIPVGIHGVV